MKKMTIEGNPPPPFMYIESDGDGMWRADFGANQPRFVVTDTTLFCSENTVKTIIHAVSRKYFPQHIVVRVGENWLFAVFETPGMTPEKFAAEYFFALISGKIENVNVSENT